MWSLEGLPASYEFVTPKKRFLRRSKTWLQKKSLKSSKSRKTREIFFKGPFSAKHQYSCRIRRHFFWERLFFIIIQYQKNRVCKFFGSQRTRFSRLEVTTVSASRRNRRIKMLEFHNFVFGKYIENLVTSRRVLHRSRVLKTFRNKTVSTY